ncbi:vacuolar-type Ca2+-ATPase, putative [Trypanosoma brucei gambiense DAL972]|uniref:Calcium-transporting ATPase n=1 Tax=Trypanosoma brucei gambiense (strain MHOM/CI/86/DAL972) TaxID=679716 RepID=C9ZUN6_TRYB9|nr:vacuolar-type Ca2+-ATPase, putative [Trypanosoma brucei gambiense DAL972]CBH13124.1 vacuolar-type Ca2+-ATPase, putative [Trypanosoma brucei gambiense DAL972]|eukprot:XP_011775401.1 vacuolar-type Ca2+-ATPase, putative [Trypanosoma brucei gambiense DAL972]
MHPLESPQEHKTQVSPENNGNETKSVLQKLFTCNEDPKPLYEELGGVEGIAERLGTSITDGIDSFSVENRRAVYGRNELPEEAPLTFWKIFKAAWSDRMIILLTLAACVSLILGLTVPEPGHEKVDYKTGWIEGTAILMAVIAVTSASSIQDYRKELKFRALVEENSAQPISVIRDGHKVTVDVTEIVVGDLVSLSPGLVIPVDGLYVRGLSVVVDESSVTGENDLKKKGAEHPILLSGTVVSTAEDAYILACAVGESSFGGKLLMESRLDGEPRATPLQERLDELAAFIGRVAIISAVLLFIVLCIIEIERIATNKQQFYPKKFLNFLLLCVTIVVVAVPEGLPLAVTIALAYSQNQMQKDNNQVRRLCACETMGNATQICSDKTGTLTQNRMTVVQGYIGMRRFRVTNPGDPSSTVNLEGVSSDAQSLLMLGLALNSSSEKELLPGNVGAESDLLSRWTWRTDKGNKTDQAILDFVDRVLISVPGSCNDKELPHQKLRMTNRSRGFAIFPFTSERKFMTAVVAGADGVVMQHVKGGSDRVLGMCNRYLSSEGREEPLTEEVTEMITAQIRSIAGDANRTIGVAYGRIGTDGAVPEEEPEGPFVWLALLGIQDPLRPEVVDAVRMCQRAGVTVRMCTGDNLDTAVAISRQCGIYNRLRGDLALTGKDFRNLVYDTYGDEANMEKLWPVLDRMMVMGRSQPLDKQLLVLMLMLRGEVVAVTGDGTNDAPALRLANVGFVMRSGTDIAVKSGDIVLLDDNFRSVQRAVVWGRTVNDNIRKFLQLQLSINIASIVVVFVGSFLSAHDMSPLTTVQLLWVNLLMDTLAALALATEQPTEDCLNRGPSSPRAPLVSRRMWLTILTATVVQVVSVLLLTQYGGKWLKAKGKELPTVVFNVFIFFTIFNMFNARKVYDEVNVFEGLFIRSKSFLVIVVCCVGFQVLAVEVLKEFMSCVPLRAEQWIASILIASLTLVFVSVSRLIPVSEPSFEKGAELEDMEPGARRIAVKLAEDVEHHSSASNNVGSYMRFGQRLVARAQWQRVREHVTMRGVSQFWWSRHSHPRERGARMETYGRLVRGTY